MLSEITAVDRVEVLENGTVQIRQRISIIDTDTQETRASRFHRRVIRPGEPLTDLDDRTILIIKAAWMTPQPPADGPAPDVAP